MVRLEGRSGICVVGETESGIERLGLRTGVRVGGSEVGFQLSSMVNDVASQSLGNGESKSLGGPHGGWLGSSCTVARLGATKCLSVVGAMP